MRVAVVGASGYTGLELMRILLQHPHFEVVAATSEQRAGVPVGDAFPSLRDCQELVFEANDPSKLIGRIDFAFCALPHAASAPTVCALREANIPVADLSADFRLRDATVYAEWYGDHPAPELIGALRRRTNGSRVANDARMAGNQLQAIRNQKIPGFGPVAVVVQICHGGA